MKPGSKLIAAAFSLGIVSLGCASTGLQTPAPPRTAIAPVSMPRLAGFDTAVRVASHNAASVAVPDVQSFLDSGAVAAALATDAPARAMFDASLQANGRCPAEMALVAGRVCVDRWEGTLIERTSNGSERVWSPFHPIEGHESTIHAVSKPGVLPQGYISGKQASEACMASGKRLCTSSEWETACRGPANTQFPYGDTRKQGVCNDDIRPLHPVAEAGQLLGIGSHDLWREGMNQTIINQLPDTLLPTGDRSECTNGYGVYDMVGNLHEWVDDPDGTFRGGYYMDTTKNGDGCSYATTAHDFTYHDYSTGFRCCMDPERVE